MFALIITVLIVLFALYFALHGKTVIIPGNDYTLNGRLYGEAEKQKHDSAILFISGWNHASYRLTNSSFYAVLFPESLIQSVQQ